MTHSNALRWFGSALLTASLLVFMTSALAVNAQSTTSPSDYGLKNTATAAGLPVGSADPIAVASTVINTVLGVIGVAAVIIIIYAGFTWLTSSGNEEKITKAKKILSGAVIGLFIILASYALASFVLNTIVKSTGSSSNTNTPTIPDCASVANQTCMSQSSCTTLKGAALPSTSFFCPTLNDVCCLVLPNP